MQVAQAWEASRVTGSHWNVQNWQGLENMGMAGTVSARIIVLREGYIWGPFLNTSLVLDFMEKSNSIDAALIQIFLKKARTYA